MHIYRPEPALAFNAGELVHQLASGKCAFGIGKQLEEDLKFPQGKCNRLTVHRSGNLILVQYQVSHGQLLFCRNVGPAQKGFDVQ